MLRPNRFCSSSSRAISAMKCKATQPILNFSGVCSDECKYRRNGDSGRLREESRKQSSFSKGSVFSQNKASTGRSAVANVEEESGLATSASFNGSRFVDSKADS